MCSVSLKPEIRVTKRGEKTISPENVKGWISLGQPMPISVTEKFAANDEELLYFLQE
jgi:hypothetical protein